MNWKEANMEMSTGLRVNYKKHWNIKTGEILRK